MDVPLSPFFEASESTYTAYNDPAVASDDAVSPRSSDSGRTITPAFFSAGQGFRDWSVCMDSTNAPESMYNTWTTESEQPFLGHLAPFRFDGFDPRLKCPLPDCHKMTSCWDPLVVICPACGTDSFTRYCKKQHLYEDIVRHWLEDCGNFPITGPIDRHTVRQSQIPPRTYVTGHFANHIERHRQAVYRAMEYADYFVFDDADLLDSARPSKEEWNLVRGRGQLRFAIKFTDGAPRLGEFDIHMMQCLKFSGPMALHNCDMAMHMIRETLILQGSWTEDILTDLCMQVAYEWNGYKVPKYFYNAERANMVYHVFGVLPSPPAFRQQ